jgi:hypothetical protein
MMPSVAKRRNITSIRSGGSFAPPSSHQVITAMKEPTTYWTIQLVVHAAGGLLVLLVPMVLSIYKPQGVTLRGWRKQFQQQSSS